MAKVNVFLFLYTKNYEQVLGFSRNILIIFTERLGRVAVLSLKT